MKESDYYAKIFMPTVNAAAKLRLGPSSRWQVYFYLLSFSRRLEGRDVWKSVAEIAEVTGLSTRTVKAAIAFLEAEGHVSRPERCKCLRVKLASSTAASSSVTQGLLDEYELPIPGQRV